MSDQFQVVYTCRKCHEGPCKVATGGDNFQTPDYCPFQLDADSHFQRVNSPFDSLLSLLRNGDQFRDWLETQTYPDWFWDLVSPSWTANQFLAMFRNVLEDDCEIVVWDEETEKTKLLSKYSKQEIADVIGREAFQLGLIYGEYLRWKKNEPNLSEIPTSSN